MKKGGTITPEIENSKHKGDNPNRGFLKTEASKYALFGALFGLYFPLFATLFDIIRLDVNINLSNLIRVQVDNPIHFIIDTAPLFLGFFAF